MEMRTEKIHKKKLCLRLARSVYVKNNGNTKVQKKRIVVVAIKFKSNKKLQ